MELIITSQYRCNTARLTSQGENALSEPIPIEDSLEGFLEWLNNYANSYQLKFDCSASEILITTIADDGTEKLRTSLACNDGDRPELMAALAPFMEANEPVTQ